MSRTLRGRVQDEAISIGSVIVPVVRGLDQERDKAILHFLYNVDERVSERTTCIDTSLTLEVDPVDSAIYITVPEIVQVRVALVFQSLDYLSVDAVLALVINLTLISKHHGLAPIHINLSLATIRN